MNFHVLTRFQFQKIFVLTQKEKEIKHSNLIDIEFYEHIYAHDS